MSNSFEAARAAFTEGVRLFEAGQLPQAEALFLESLRRVPARPSTLANLALVRQRLGRPAEALEAIEQALQVQPDDVPAWFHRGQLLQQLQRPADALAAYERLLALDATHGTAWMQRGSLLKDMGRFAEAAASFRQALAHGADEELNRYFLASAEAALGAGPGGGGSQPPAGPADAEPAAAAGAAANRGVAAVAAPGGGGSAHEAPPPAAAPATAPRHYVQSLFDSYAEDFDQHLVGKLGYRTPWLLAQLLGLPAPAASAASAASGPSGSPATATTAAIRPATLPPTTPTTTPPPHWRSALDLGCGTGLMGPLLAPHCGVLDGIDLSPLMLQKARALGCYRHLVHGDIVEHLRSTGDSHDLAVAADVFVYIGELQPVFEGVARVLGPGGSFAFSVEVAGAGNERYELRPSSRYAHGEAYVRALAAAAGFEVAAMERTVLRHDQRHPIGGLLWRLVRRGVG
ncbi:MAG: tetratricopeptide repeat protein [Rubrivivax sp.]|nr:tetratricopeptide repeat protein [Rubrivivax sp.]